MGIPYQAIQDMPERDVLYTYVVAKELIERMEQQNLPRIKR